MLLIVWHSRTGAAKSLAHAAFEGAAAQDDAARPSAVILPAAEVTPERFLAAAGYLFVCPENLGSMTGAMKEMFDCCYYPLLGRIEGRAFATIVTAGSDGHGAQAQVERIVTGWRLRRVAEPWIVNLSAQTPEAILASKEVRAAELAKARDLGYSLAEGLALGIF
ncbi:MAG: NAD(P)H-dependent oxidoreductase [Pseudomonadota bacterium]